jgi:hypothetical protein
VLLPSGGSSFEESGVGDSTQHNTTQSINQQSIQNSNE